jgi:type IV secretory pathway VirB2 component (pilin)
MAALAFAVVLIVAGVTWLFGPLGLVGAGCVLGVCTLILSTEE